MEYIPKTCGESAAETLQAGEQLLAQLFQAQSIHLATVTGKIQVATPSPGLISAAVSSPNWPAAEEYRNLAAGKPE